MRIQFFTAPFYFAFIWFRVEVAASPPFLEDGILVSLPSPWGKALSIGIVFPHMHVFALSIWG